MPRTAVKPRRVLPFHNGCDWNCALLGTFGFSSRHIAEKTGLSFSQISYRLKKFQITRREYRDGYNLGARAVIETAQKIVYDDLNDYLHEQLD